MRQPKPINNARALLQRTRAHLPMSVHRRRCAPPINTCLLIYLHTLAPWCKQLVSALWNRCDSQRPVSMVCPTSALQVSNTITFVECANELTSMVLRRYALQASVDGGGVKIARQIWTMVSECRSYVCPFSCRRRHICALVQSHADVHIGVDTDGHAHLVEEFAQSI